MGKKRERVKQDTKSEVSNISASYIYLVSLIQVNKTVLRILSLR